MKHSITMCLAFTLTLQGCAFGPQLNRIAVDYNSLVAKTEDELALLNIVRAKEQYPLHFTTITGLRGNVTASMTAQSGSSLVEQASGQKFNAQGQLTEASRNVGVDIFTPFLGGTVSTTPSFDVSVLNSEKFQRGIQQPIKAEQLDYFLEQGWPEELLKALFIESVSFVLTEDQHGTLKGKAIEKIRNDPDDPDDSKIFKLFADNNILKLGTSKAKPTVIVDLDIVTKNSSVADLALLDGKTWDVGEVDGRKVIQRNPASTPRFVFEPPLKIAQHLDAAGADEGLQTAENMPTQNKSHSHLMFKATGAFPMVELANPNGDYDASSGELTREEMVDGQLVSRTYNVRVVVVLRSVQGIIYFLGEYVRSASPYALKSGKPIFDIKTGAGDAAIAVRFDGERHYIPRSSNARTLQTLDLVQQLVNLHKSSDDLPTTRAVTIVP